MSKSKSAHSLASTTTSPKSKPTPTRTGTLTATKETTTTSQSGGRTKAPSSATGKDSASKDGDVHQEHHENGNGVEVVEETSHPEIGPFDAESHEDEYLGNGSLDASYTEESLDTMDDASAHDHEEVVYSPVDQSQEGTPEDLVRSFESVDPTASILHAEDNATSETLDEVGADTVEPNQEGVKDYIADMVGLLESTSFTSKHILQGPDEGISSDLHPLGSDKERQRIGEIPDEE